MAPFGFDGGEAGRKGENTRVKADGTQAELPGATSFEAEAGESLIIKTPGGGGYGNPAFGNGGFSSPLTPIIPSLPNV